MRQREIDHAREGPAVMLDNAKCKIIGDKTNTVGAGGRICACCLLQYLVEM